MSKRKRINLSVSHDLHDRLWKEADRQGKSVSDLVREFCSFELNKPSTPEQLSVECSGSGAIVRIPTDKAIDMISNPSYIMRDITPLLKEAYLKMYEIQPEERSSLLVYEAA